MCAVLAASLSILAFVLYNLRNSAGQTHPNVSSWAVWAFITILNFTSYKKMTGDWVKSVLPTVDSAMCIITALLAFHTGSIRGLSGTDQACFWLGVTAGVGWWIFKSANFAQVLLEIALVVGFIPTFVGVWHQPSVEPYQSWFLWTGSFVAQFYTVKYTWRGAKIDFLYPVNMAVFHCAVFALALR
jgi:hypothetical protein